MKLLKLCLFFFGSNSLYHNLVSANTLINSRSFIHEQHGESDMNMDGRIGGDSDLSYRGKLYATALANYIHQQDIPGLRVWTSWLKRTIQTVATIPAPQERWKALNEIDAVSITGTYQVCSYLHKLGSLLPVPRSKSFFQCLVGLPLALYPVDI
jgi:hypothetical protein